MALYGGLLAGAGALIGWQVVTMRSRRRGWRYQIPHQARKYYKQAYQQFAKATKSANKATRVASKATQKALRNAGGTVGGLPVISSLPMFRRRTFWDRMADSMIGWWALVTSISLPLFSRRKSLPQRISDRISGSIPDVNLSSLNRPWKRSQKIADRTAAKVAKQSSKAADRIDRQVSKAQKRAEKAMSKLEGRSKDAMKAVSRRMPSKSDIKDMAQRGKVIERRQSVIEKLPFGERRETIVEKMPYNQ